MRSATGLSNLLRWRASRFNPRTPCGVRPVGQGWQIADVSVSIHALLAECDARWPGPPIRTAGFNPRTPCGVRQETTRPEVVKLGFQSTHSLRSATCHERKFFPRYAVSIHALLAECDHMARMSSDSREVSIHALLAECDGRYGATTLILWSFNPRTPCGVRRGPGAGPATSARFQSTHSLRSATSTHFPFPNRHRVSIHALLAECDHQCVFFFSVYILFQSTHSLRSATFVADNPMRTLEPVSIHALLAECDLQKWHDNPPMVRFNPRTPCGVRLEPRPMPKVNLGFNPRTPCGVRHAGFKRVADMRWFQSTHSLRSATAPDLIHCYSTEQIILCANLPKKTVIARLLFLSIYLSIFYSQCITPIADLPGNSCELEVGAQAMFNSL